MRRALAGAAAAVTFGAALVGSPVGTAGATPDTTNGTAATEYVVLYADGASPTVARAAIAAAGGSLVKENLKVGYALVRSTDTAFRDRVATSTALEGAARNRPVGYAPKSSRPSREAVERLTAERALAATKAAPAREAPAQGAEPLADRQWDMRQIGATANGSYRVQPGRPGVMVGIIDTGLDAQHPDIRPNFNRDLSRNFTTDIPLIDGPCEFKSCHDPVGWDDNGHGTHVGSTVAGAINGIGIAGVAPNVTLVNLRAGQDSGYFFLDPTLEAYTYAGDIGVDVINMSYYTDPWLFNCVDNPKDSPAQQREQRVIRRATQRAIDYAIARGVTPIAAEGNEATDLGHPKIDETSPDFPPGSEKTRRIDNSCITVPTETRGVISVSATGISTRKAYYSNYGTEQTDVAAPGGDYYDSPDNTGDPRNLVLAAYPERLGRLFGEIDKRGNPTTPFVVKDCLQRDTHRVCAYYQYLQGTSMASPHAVGVAALIVSQFGRRDAMHGGLTMPVDQVRHVLYQSAVEHACPQPRLFHYKRIRDDGSIGRETAFCAGPTSDNGFYGHGIVNAYAAVKFGS